jgi:hypothetical protein
MKYPHDVPINPHEITITQLLLVRPCIDVVCFADSARGCASPGRRPWKLMKLAMDNTPQVQKNITGT